LTAARLSLLFLPVPLVLASTFLLGRGERAPIIVHPDGRIGPFRIDVTTDAQIRAVAGRPARVEKAYSELTPKPVGHRLVYQCGRGCVTEYSIRRATGRLSDFSTGSPRFRTERGSRPGMSTARAARLEGRKFGPGCGDGLYLHVRWDLRHAFVLTADRGRVDGILYLGPHSVYYEGLC
jgi:hypothetical protein